jgi:hypothetical protein
MIRTLRSAVSICALLLAIAAPVCAQTAAENIAKAQQTAAEIERLLDRIQSRHSSGETGAPTAAVAADGWESLFDGKTLNGWKRTEFVSGGGVHVDTAFRGGPPAIVVDAGRILSGLTWTKDVPKTNYEITLDAMKVDGSDFMCGLTFPVGDSFASLILGGWGGTVTGISSIDGHDASENETSQFMSFDKGRWYAIRLKVTPAKLETWIDGKKVIDQPITGKTISLRVGEIFKSKPLGLATYQTSAAYRGIKLRRLDAK